MCQTSSGYVLRLAKLPIKSLEI